MKLWLKVACALCLSGSVFACGDDDDLSSDGNGALSGNGASAGTGGTGDAAGSGAVVSEPLELTILHINDHHSNLDSKSKTLQLQNAAGERVGVTVDAGGFPRVTSAIAELAEAAGDNVLKIHAGDALTGTLYFNRAGEIGEADAALMNTVCFDTFTLGNHEFDKGDTQLAEFIGRLHSGECQTPVLSANLVPGPNSALNESNAPGLVNPYVVIERGGQKIGLVGLTIASKTKQSSSPDPDTEFEKEVTAAQREIDELLAQGVNKIIVQSHIGYQYDLEVAAQLKGVDIVVGGDSHTLLGPAALETYDVGSPGGEYPTVIQNADGETTCVVQAWEYSQIVGELKVSFDADGKVSSCEGVPHVLIGNDFTPEEEGATFSEADIAAFTADIEASGFLRVTEPDAAATEVLAPYKVAVDEFKAKVVANAPEELCSRRVPGGPGSVDYSRSSAGCNAAGSVDVRGGDIQQIVAQAYLEVANELYGGADISLQSGGGVRIPLEGDVTAASVIEVLPFGNQLFRLDITGAEVQAMIEDGLEATFGAEGTTGPYPYTGGLRFDVDSTQAAGQRASNFEVYDAATQTWGPLDTAKTYKLFVLSFNAEGGDGYVTLRDVPAERRLDIGVLDADVFQTWIDEQEKNAAGLPVLEKLPNELYSTKSFK